jgi:hypothetical protein
LPALLCTLPWVDITGCFVYQSHVTVVLIFSHKLINSTFSIKTVALDDALINDLENIWKEAIMY